MFRRLSTLLLGVLVTGLSVVVGVPTATAAGAPPECPVSTVEENTKAAKAVFSGTVTAVARSPRPGGMPGGVFLQTVTVDLVYQGRIRTETVQVETQKIRGFCSLGALLEGTEYMFFVTGNGEPWEAIGPSGTRPNSDELIAEVELYVGEGDPPIEPTPEHAVFTPVETDDPQPLSRAAAPGAALVIVGLLGLVVVGAVRRRL